MNVFEHTVLNAAATVRIDKRKKGKLDTVRIEISDYLHNRVIIEVNRLEEELIISESA